MKQSRINFFVVMSGVFLGLILNGCISVQNSPTPRFYLLGGTDADQGSKKLDITPGVLIGVGPVKVPEYQERPQIVTRDKNHMLKFAQFDRWAETLDLGFTRLIGEGLAVKLPEAKFTLYPWNSNLAVKYQVVVEIVQLDSQLDKDLFLVAQWLVIDVQNSKTIIIKRSEFRQAIIPQDYSGLVKTLNTVSSALSSQIAQALSMLETNPQAKEKVLTP